METFYLKFGIFINFLIVGQLYKINVLTLMSNHFLLIANVDKYINSQINFKN